MTVIPTFNICAGFFFPLQMTSVAADYSIPVGGGGDTQNKLFC